jgi:hypothetical protein
MGLVQHRRDQKSEARSQKSAPTSEVRRPASDIRPPSSEQTGYTFVEEPVSDEVKKNPLHTEYFECYVSPNVSPISGFWKPKVPRAIRSGSNTINGIL